jgi:hypothetical protein
LPILSSKFGTIRPKNRVSEPLYPYPELRLLKNNKPIIGMIHVDPLPGTPRFKSNLPEIIAKAKAEALTYKEAGIDMLAILKR